MQLQKREDAYLECDNLSPGGVVHGSQCSQCRGLDARRSASRSWWCTSEIVVLGFREMGWEGCRGVDESSASSQEKTHLAQSGETAARTTPTFLLLQYRSVLAAAAINPASYHYRLCSVLPVGQNKRVGLAVRATSTLKHPYPISFFLLRFVRPRCPSGGSSLSSLVCVLVWRLCAAC